MFERITVNSQRMNGRDLVVKFVIDDTKYLYQMDVHQIIANELDGMSHEELELLKT